MGKQNIGTINMNELMLNQRKFTTSEIGRGTYIGKSKKGKGSYNRKQKYKKNYKNDDSSFFMHKKIGISLF